MADQLVLVWKKNRNVARIHRDEHCPTLNNSRATPIPPRHEPYRGPGTAGWLPLDEARKLPDAALCQRCM